MKPVKQYKSSYYTPPNDYPVLHRTGFYLLDLIKIVLYHLGNKIVNEGVFK